MFLTEPTQKAFDEWVSKWGATYNDSDVNQFNKFALLYCKDANNNLTKEEFVKAVKKYTHTSIKEKRGIVQKFYYRLLAIQSFCKSNECFK